MARTALLEIQVRTPHGAPITGASVILAGDTAEWTAAETTAGAYGVEISEPGDYALTVARAEGPGGFEHRTLRATLRYELSEDRATIAVPPQARSGGEDDNQPKSTSTIGDVREEGGLHILPVTLDYRWFTPIGYPPTLGNRLDVLIDGEACWAAVAEALKDARRSVHLTTWLYHATAELVRHNPFSDPEDRRETTAQQILEGLAKAGVVIRLLLWDAPLLSPPGELRRAESDEGDHFQVLEEANPTRRPLFGAQWRITNGILGSLPIGSYHQKTTVIDGRIGFCGGMNIKENDWDTRRHLVFEPRRCAFSRPASFRMEVAARASRPDHQPRHDFQARLEGPSVAHLEENFRERWNGILDRDRDGKDTARATSIAPPEPPEPPEPTGSCQVQVVRTMPARLRGADGVPSLPAERGILDIYLRAIGEARRLIYIEDQYFRSTRISCALADALRAYPALDLVVLTAERQVNDILARGWSGVCFEQLQAERPAFELYSMRVSDVDRDGKRTLEEVDNHAKLLIVDDQFVLVGSCNVNDRGFDFEGEIDVATADPELARSLRLDLWREHLGGDARLSGDITADLQVWREHAERNRVYDPAAAADPPASFIFPFVPKGRKWTLVGSDVF